MLSIFYRSAVVIFASAILVASTFAQTSANKKMLLRGKVVDPNRAAVAGADIWATGSGLPSSSAVTDRNGEFSLMLEAGEYNVRVLADGFSEVIETVNHSRESSQPLEIVLSVAPSSASVPSLTRTA